MLVDSNLIAYWEDGYNTLMKIKVNKNKIILISFIETSAIIKRNCVNLNEFTMAKFDTELCKDFLNDFSQDIPENGSFKLFQFIDAKDQVAIEIICEDFSFDVYDDDLSTIKILDKVFVKAGAPKQYYNEISGIVIGLRTITTTEVSSLFHQPIDSVLHLVEFLDGSTFEVPNIYLEKKSEN